MTALTLIVTPHGRLLLESGEDAPDLPSDLAHRLQEAFARGSGHGLLQLGAAEVGTPLPPVFGHWREPGARYVSAVCGREDLRDRDGSIRAVHVSRPSERNRQADESWDIGLCPPSRAGTSENTDIYASMVCQKARGRLGSDEGVLAR